MPQIFPRSANAISRATIYAGLLLLASLSFGGYVFARSPYITNVGVPRQQPVQFSHEHHVKDDGIDCRYCHTTVETSAFAGIPSTEICMNCHREVWNESPTLEPVRQSFATGQPIAWTRVTQLPDFVYFNHSIHIQKGIGCDSCHGRVDLMPLTYKAKSLQMSFCLDCHRDPAQYIRPRDQVTNLAYQYPQDQETLGHQLMAEYQVKPPSVLTSCSTCHR